MYDCSYCGRWADTDDGEGKWDVPRINSTKKYTYVCGVCCEKYVTEDGQFDEALEDVA